MEEAGAFAVVVECVPATVAAKVTAALKIPTIGIGAGSECDGQVLVGYDLLGMFDDVDDAAGNFGRRRRTARLPLGSRRAHVRSGRLALKGSECRR